MTMAVALGEGVYVCMYACVRVNVRVYMFVFVFAFAFAFVFCGFTLVCVLFVCVMGASCLWWVW